MKENIKNRKYNGKGYDSKGNIIYKLNNLFLDAIHTYIIFLKNFYLMVLEK